MILKNKTVKKIQQNNAGGIGGKQLSFPLANIMRRLILEDYNKKYANEFIEIRNLLKECLGDAFIRAHHIGSTAIVGIKSKPIIDVLLEADSLDGLDQASKCLASAGYLVKGEYGIPGRRFFTLGEGDDRKVHIHSFESGDPHILRHLRFRDYLNIFSKDAKRYNDLKLHLANEHDWNLEKYIEGKDSFIKEIDEKAKQFFDKYDTNSSFGLFRPSAILKDSYMQMIASWESTGEKKVPFVLDYDYADFDKLIESLEDLENLEKIAQGFVTSSTYWLVDDKLRILAVSNLRHELNERLMHIGGHIGYGTTPGFRRRGYASMILNFTLEKAKSYGIDRALVTCDKENEASSGVIMNSGGVLDSEILFDGKIVQRYWIENGEDNDF